MPRIRAAGNWTEVASTKNEWTPALGNPTIQGMQTFENSGRTVNLHIGVFVNETSQSKLVTSNNKFVNSSSHSWSQVSTGHTRLKISDTEISPKTGVIVGGGQRIIAWQWYWLNGRSTGGDVQAKVWQLVDKLHGKANIGVWLAVSTHASGSDLGAEQQLKEFTQELAPEILIALEAFAMR